MNSTLKRLKYWIYGKTGCVRDRSLSDTGVYQHVPLYDAFNDNKFDFVKGYIIENIGPNKQKQKFHKREQKEKKTGISKGLVDHLSGLPVYYMLNGNCISGILVYSYTENEKATFLEQREARVYNELTKAFGWVEVDNIYPALNDIASVEINGDQMSIKTGTTFHGVPKCLSDERSHEHAFYTEP